MSDLFFDGFELSPEKLSLHLDGEMVRLEPRLTELLIFLVRHRDRVVTKEELIEEVWQGRFVGDSAISRAVYEVRRALGDDSKNPRYLRTIHGRGYQFVGQVSSLMQPEVGAADDKNSGRSPVDSEVPSPSQSLTAAVAEGREPPTDRGSVLRPIFLIALTGLLFALGLALFTVILNRSASELPVGTETLSTAAEATLGQTETREEDLPHLPEGTRIALLPVLATEHVPDLQLLALSLTDLLHQQLTATEGLIVRAPAYDRAPLENLAEFSAEIGAENLLVGSVSRGEVSDMVRVEFELVDVNGQRARSTPLGPLSIRPPASGQDLQDFLALRDAIVDEVLGILDHAFMAPGGDANRPTNYSAYRLFLLAHQKVLESFCDGSGAIELLERSLEEDPTYSPAWTLLAAAHCNQVWACGASAEHYEHARRAIEKAVALDPNYVSPRLVENAILVETGEVEVAFERLNGYLEDHPVRAELLASKLYSLRFAGFLDEAERTLSALLEMDPFYFTRGASGESPNTLMYRGDFSRFLQVLPDSDAAMHLYYRGLAEVLNGRPEVAREILAPVFRNQPADIFARYSEALVAVLEGKEKEAGLIVDQIVRQRDQLEAVDGEMSFKEAQLYLLSGQTEKAIIRLQRSFDQGFFCPKCLVRDPVLRPLHSDPRFSKIVQGASDRHLAFSRRFGLESELPE